MSRKLLAFLLSELQTVRVICRRPTCGAVSEMSVEQMAAKFRTSAHPPECPICGGVFQGIPGGPANEFVRLAEAIKAIRDRKDAVEIEFVLPDNSAE